MAHQILVVDDSPVIRSVYRVALGKTGCQIVEAENGKVGLEALRRMVDAGTRPVVIFVDLNMPVMDGITFIKHVKKSSCQNVPILVVTTESERAKIQEGKEAGATAWIVKPFNDAQIVALVQKILSQPTRAA